MRSQRKSSEFYYFHAQELQECNDLLECSWDEIMAAILPEEQLPIIQREWPRATDEASKEFWRSTWDDRIVPIKEVC